MKRIWILMLVCLLLCGCGAVSSETTPTETAPSVPTEPAGSYAPESELEQQTGGAVRVYPLESTGNYAIACMDGDLVVFSGDVNTIITKLTGDNLYAAAQKEVDTYLDNYSASTQVTEKGISYFNGETREVVLLDTNLREVARIPAPEGLVGVPVLSANRQMMYYCTDNAIRVLDMGTGISRILKEITCQDQSVVGLYLNDSVLKCSFYDGYGGWRVLFISTENGQMVWESDDDFSLYGKKDTYYTRMQEGTMEVLVFGFPEQEARMLIPRDLDATTWFANGMHGLVTSSGTEDEGLTLDYYDLDSGLRFSSFELAEYEYLWDVAADEETGELYLLSWNVDNEAETIYRWDTKAHSSGDETVYTSRHYTIFEPDTQGLSDCRAYAEEIGERYGVRILIGEEAVETQPWDYTMTIEYQVPLIRRDLELLDRVLGNYPEGFFREAVAATPSKELTISLVRTLRGSAESGSLDLSDAIQFWVDENAYIALAVDMNVEQMLYHEMFHVLESKVLSDCTAYYEWDKLNPEDFEYDYDYIANQDRGDYQYLEDDTRAFIDMYSMSFPKEDRARIMEYAMTPDHGDYFRSETMQKKLYQLCLGIRQAFDLEDVQEEFLWEQYLDQAFVEKD